MTSTPPTAAPAPPAPSRRPLAPAPSVNGVRARNVPGRDHPAHADLSRPRGERPPTQFFNVSSDLPLGMD